VISNHAREWWKLSERKSIPSIMLSEEKNSQFALGKQLENFKKKAFNILS
jgi:hypothetical protein